MLVAGLLLALGLGFSLGPSGAAARQKIYFYNPESNINNFSSLKTEFDSYLSGVGNFEFQPFASAQTFEQFLSQEQESIFLLSGWHFHNVRAKYAMKPLLVGSVGGKPTQRRGLFARKAVADLGALKGQKIASAGSREFTQNLLNQMFQQRGRPELAETVRIIPVPKDIDALMAVALGLASAALTTDGSVEQLKTINAKHYETLHRLGESDELPRVIVAVKESSPDTVFPLVKALERMASLPKGEYAMQMIGLDGWQQYDACCSRLRQK